MRILHSTLTTLHLYTKKHHTLNELLLYILIAVLLNLMLQLFPLLPSLGQIATFCSHFHL